MTSRAGSISVCAIACAVFAMLAWALVAGRIDSIDGAILGLFRTGADQSGVVGPPWLQETGRDVTAMGSLVILGFIAAVMLGYFVIAGRRQEAARHMLMLVLSVAGAFGLKLVFNRPRPDLPALARVFTPSFPSGHATISAALLVSIAYLVAQRTTSPAVQRYAIAVSAFAIVAIGISRVYLGVHYPSDVLSGWAVGVFAFTLANWPAPKFT